MVIFLSCSPVSSTTGWLHHMNFKTPVVKAREEHHNNATCCFKQIQGTKPNKIEGVQPLTTLLKTHPNKTSKTC